MLAMICRLLATRAALAYRLLGGKYHGKSGTISWRGTQAADGESNTSVGSGQWY